MSNPAVDYLDAFERHSHDAEILYQRARWANADHLFGVSAECGLKAVMLALDILRLDHRGRPQRDYQVHIDELWNKFTSLGAGSQAGKYIGLIPNQNPFSNWRIEQRYAPASSITQSIAHQHRTALDDVRRVVLEAKLDGIL